MGYNSAADMIGLSSFV